MTTTARVLTHSSHPYSPVAPDVLTLELYYPQIIHAELMAHGMFVRNAASFRAKPGRRLRAEIRADLAEPVQYGSHKAGMQAGPTSEALTGVGRLAWRVAAFYALCVSALMDRAGLAKEIYNRLVMPFAHMSVVVTGTSETWANFLCLRNHPDADPTMQALAEVVRQAIAASAAKTVPYGGWHAPYHPDDVQRSVAACARVSYRSFAENGRETTREEDLRLYERLLGGKVKHASPAGHQATPVYNPAFEKKVGNLGQWWHQYRHDLEGEVFADLHAVLDPEFRNRQTQEKP